MSSTTTCHSQAVASGSAAIRRFNSPSKRVATCPSKRVATSSLRGGLLASRAAQSESLERGAKEAGDRRDVAVENALVPVGGERKSGGNSGSYGDTAGLGVVNDHVG
jgi:hypothetical protein